MTDTREDNLQEIAQIALGSIRDMVAALECDRERLGELRKQCDDYDPGTIAEKLKGSIAEQWAVDHPAEANELAALEKSADEARERIQADPLSIEYRTGWMSRRETVERDDWAEACILLATGGPAVRIIVELHDGEPHRAYLQVQDWGTPWTEYYEEGIGELLMTYVAVFCSE